MPKGEQGPKWDEHRIDQMIEDVLFLHESGVPLDKIVQRTGLKKGSIETAFERRGKRAPWVQVREQQGCTTCGKTSKRDPLHPATYVQATKKTSRLALIEGEPLVLHGKFCSWSCYETWIEQVEAEHGPDARNRERLMAERVVLQPGRISDGF